MFNVIGTFLIGLIFLAGCGLSKASEKEVSELMGQHISELVRDVLANKVATPKLEAIALQLGIKDVAILAIDASPLGLAAYAKGHIIVDAALENAPKEVIAFVLAHEYGHHTKEHWRGTLARAIAVAKEQNVHEPELILSYVSKVKDKAQAHANEFEADAFAKNLVASKGLWNGLVVEDFFEKNFNNDESDSHPSMTARMIVLGLRK